MPPEESSHDLETGPLNPESVNVIGQHTMKNGGTCDGGRVTLTPGRGDIRGMQEGVCAACDEPVVKAPKGWITMAQLLG